MKTETTPFPLRVAGTGDCMRYLERSDGRPFFYQADTAWKLKFRLTTMEAEEYLTVRKSQGFTAVQIILSGFLDDTDRMGRMPFGEDHDFASPDITFFNHVEALIAIAGDLDLLVAMVPLWSGCCGEGWTGVGRDGTPKPVNVNGIVKCGSLGEWLGNRFRHHDNVIWVLGGDQDPDNARDEIRALATGLKATAPHHLLTYHASSTHSSADVWPEDEPWLDVSMIYTYFRGFDKAWNKIQPDVYELAGLERRKHPGRPFILGESTYEGEHGDWGSALQVRKQAYWAFLSGACGHAYGSPNWHLPDNWREMLDLPGARSMQYLADLISKRPWHLLAPDENETLFSTGRGPYGRNDYATAAVASDCSFAIAYAPSARTLGCDFSAFRPMRASWYDPTDGTSRSAAAEPPDGSGMSRYATPGPNAYGDPDWVLLLERMR